MTASFSSLHRFSIYKSAMILYFIFSQVSTLLQVDGARKQTIWRAVVKALGSGEKKFAVAVFSG